jgi:hypothetical protein
LGDSATGPIAGMVQKSGILVNSGRAEPSPDKMYAGLFLLFKNSELS